MAISGVFHTVRDNFAALSLFVDRDYIVTNAANYHSKFFFRTPYIIMRCRPPERTRNKK